MAALTAGRNYLTKTISYASSCGVLAATKIYGGSMVCIGATGYAIPAADAAGMVGPAVNGIAEADIDNSAGAAGAKRVTILHGVFSINNDTDAVTIVEQGKPVYVKDDNTVRKGVGTNSVVAGTCIEFDAEGLLWIKIP